MVLDLVLRYHLPCVSRENSIGDWSLTVRCRAVAIPRNDATGQDALDGAAVELFEDLGTHAKSFRSPEGKMVLSCPLHNCLGVFGP